MSEVNTGGGGEQKKGKPKKMTLRVDFTPMVDMNMLLITFFMFCTSLAKPQTLEIAMPVKDDLKTEEKSKVKDDKAITIILGGENKVYYYLGKQNIKDFTSLKRATYGGIDDPNSLRTLLTSRNRVAIDKINELRRLRDRKEIKDDFYKEEVKKIKNAKNGEVVIIKPMDACVYQNVIDALDEVAITQIGTYTIQDLTEPDQFMVENLESNGAKAEEYDFEAQQKN
jgi:biopolymer transport protein ExbD